MNHVTEIGLKVFKKVERSARGKIVEGQFQVHGQINILLTIEAQASVDTIEFSFVNLDRFGKVSHSLLPEEIDAHFVDQLGRYITRQTDALKREELSAEQRSKLKRAIQSNNRELFRSLDRR